MFLLKKASKFFLATILAIGIITFIGRHVFFRVIIQPSIWLYLAVFILLGLFLGLCISLWREDESKKNSSYNLGLSISSILGVILLTIFGIYPNFLKSPKTNIEDNRDLLNFKPSTVDSKNLFLAYKYFVKEIGNENRIKLKGCSVQNDSTNSQRTLYRFKYHLESDTAVYIAKIEMLDTLPSLLYLNRNIKNDFETIAEDEKSADEVNTILKGLDSLMIADTSHIILKKITE